MNKHIIKLLAISIILLNSNMIVNTAEFKDNLKAVDDYNFRCIELDRLLLKASEEGNINKINSLINKGANINIQDCAGYTPLHIASSKGRKDIVQLLLDKGANVNKRDLLDRAPLYWPVFLGDIDMAKQLINHGAKVDVKHNRDNMTLLDMVRNDREELIKSLQEYKYFRGLKKGLEASIARKQNMIDFLLNNQDK